MEAPKQKYMVKTANALVQNGIRCKVGREIELTDEQAADPNISVHLYTAQEAEAVKTERERVQQEKEKEAVRVQAEAEAAAREEVVAADVKPQQLEETAAVNVVSPVHPIPVKDM